LPGVTPANSGFGGMLAFALKLRCDRLALTGEVHGENNRALEKTILPQPDGKNSEE